VEPPCRHLDLTLPVNAAGTVRTRLVAHADEQDGFIDLEHTRNTTFYGVLDADLGPRTRLSIGASDQNDQRRGIYWGGLSYWYTDGTRTDWDRSKTTASRWHAWDSHLQNVFASLSHDLDGGWKVQGHVSHDKLTEDSDMMYVYGTPDRVTGLGLSGDRNAFHTEPTQDYIVVRANGPFDLGGRTHELAVGASHGRFKGGWDYSWPVAYAVPMGDFNAWDGSFTGPDMEPFFAGDRYTTTQTGLYAATRLRVTEPLKLILGGRLSNWRRDMHVAGYTPEPYTIEFNRVFTPYAGVVYDLGERVSAYASYTSIFNPQDKRTRDGSFLDPLKGKSYEAGLKGEFLASALNASAAIFRIDQDNYPVEDGVVAGTSTMAYRQAQGVRTQGYELEASGAPAPDWELGAGWTQYSARDAQHRNVAEQHPRKLLKLFTKYTFGGDWQGLSAGAGVNWQNKPPKLLPNPVTGQMEEVGQPSYALVDLMARYTFSTNTSAQLNIGNAFDKKYYTSGYDWIVYGQPRSFTLSVKQRF
jgi:outer membrane receptor for ferric coprogen and ferric-rhodotorulic acid